MSAANARCFEDFSERTGTHPFASTTRPDAEQIRPRAVGALEHQWPLPHILGQLDPVLVIALGVDHQFAHQVDRGEDVRTGQVKLHYKNQLTAQPVRLGPEAGLTIGTKSVF